ncbi:hypothetical protein R20943_06419 [Paraburkholderia aspalathi]|nr:hypothetical protein R20943_06419 [Paraburkholderia aspalathi]
MRDLDRAAELLNDLPEKQVSLTDPDSRSMVSQAKGTGVVGYNVQVAVDARHHLIVTHEVTNVGNDRTQLSPMAKAAHDAMGKKKIKALADRGYFSAPEIKACDDAGITALVPKSQTSGAKADGRFDRADFIYIARDDQYLCPAGQRDIPLHLVGECQSAETADLLEHCLPTLSAQKAVHAGAVSAHSPMGTRSGTRQNATQTGSSA